MTQLRAIAAVTFSASRFDASAEALQTILGYRQISTSSVSDALAAYWSAPAVAGNRVALFAPASAEPVYVRLVESARRDDFAPFKTFGWNAAELHVSDVAALRKRLDGSSYEVLGEPRDLLDNGTVIAMQVAGPSDEVFYLTRIDSAKMQETYGRARSFVGRTFIAVLGASNHAASLAWYGAITRGSSRPRRMNIRVLAAAHGLKRTEAMFPIGAAILEDRFRIEIDGYPDSAAARGDADGALPPGMCMVSFVVDSLSDLPVTAACMTTGLGGPLYGDGRVARINGPDGEWLELIEAPAP